MIDKIKKHLLINYNIFYIFIMSKNHDIYIKIFK